MHVNYKAGDRNGLMSYDNIYCVKMYVVRTNNEKIYV